MTRRIALTLSLLVWVLIGKAMAQNHQGPSFAVKACIENTLAKNIEKPFALTINHNFEMAECATDIQDCHRAGFQAVAADGTLYKGQVSVIADALGNCHTAEQLAHPLSLVNAANANSSLADKESEE